MKRNFYITPSTEAVEVCSEGLLCASPGNDENQILLPDAEWKDETVW